MTAMAEEFGAPQGYKGLPLPGSPAARLRDETVKGLASGRLRAARTRTSPRSGTCPPGCSPAWPARTGSSRRRATSRRPAPPAVAPPSVVAAWITEGVPCVAGLCEAAARGPGAADPQLAGPPAGARRLSSRRSRAGRGRGRGVFRDPPGGGRGGDDLGGGAQPGGPDRPVA